MLFDLVSDPDELRDLGGEPGHEEIVGELYAILNEWARRPSQRTTVANESLLAYRKKPSTKGVMIGVVEEGDVPVELVARYTGLKARDRREK